MAKESKYGEKTKMVNYRVPESKVTEINQIVKLKLNEYEKNALVSLEVQSSEVSQKNQTVEKKSNPADESLFVRAYNAVYNEPTIEPKVVEIENDTAEFKDNGWLDSKLIPSEDLNAKVESLPSNAKFISNDAKKDKVKILQEIADTIKNGGGGKSMAFTTVKKPIDEIYDCICVEKGIPAESDRIYYGANNRIAFWDRDDVSVFYANWENKYYQFANSKEFNKFCKDNQIK